MWCRRNRTAAAFLVVLSLFAGFSTWQWLRAEGLRRQAERDARGGEIDQALAFCSQGEVGRGLLKLAGTLRNAPSNSDDLKRAIRANIIAWTPYAIRLRAVLPHAGQVYAVAYSPDGKTIVTVGSRNRDDGNLGRPIGGTAQLWDRETCEPRGGPLTHGASVLAAVFSPDGRLLGTGGADGAARLWRVADGSPLGAPLRLDGQVHCIAFSPDGRILVTGSTDRSARFWDPASGARLGEPLKHEYRVTQVGFRPDGRVVFTGCLDGRVRLWDAQTRRLISDQPRMRGRQEESRPARIATFGGGGTSLVTNQMLSSTEHVGAGLWDGATGEPIGNGLFHDRSVCAVALSQDGRIALSGGEDKTARLWDARTGRSLGPPLHHQETVRAVVLSHDGTLALAGTDGGTAQLWDVSTGKSVGNPMRHETGRSIRDLAFHPSGREVVTASEDGTARVWSLPSGRQTEVSTTDAGLNEQEPRLAYSPDRRLMLVAYTDGTARVRDAVTQIESGMFLKHDKEVLSVAWSPDGRRLLTGCIDGTVRVWLARTREPFGKPVSHQGPVRSVAFSPDGHVVLSGGEDKTARLWDAESGKPIGPPLIHNENVVAAAFSPDGRTLLTLTEDGTVRRWAGPTVPRGPDELFILWAELVTGSTAEEDGSLRGLDAKSWRRKHQRLRELGGAGID